MKTITMNPKTKKFIKNRKLIDKIFKLVHDLTIKAGIPVFYNLLELDNVTNPVIAVRDLLAYYFNNSNHNALILVSTATGNRQWYLVATLAKPLGNVNNIQHYLKLESNKFIKVQNTPLNDFEYLSGAINDLITKTHYSSVKRGFQSFNDRITIAYSQAVYHDHKNTFNVDDTDNHGRLVEIEKVLMNNKGSN